MTLLLWLAVAHSTDHVGDDLAGADLILADGDTITGTFTSVGRLEVPADAVVVATDLQVEAVEIVVEGTLHADGTGHPGGQGPGAGVAPPGGYGTAGGGGGGHVGRGGDGSPGQDDDTWSPGGLENSDGAGSGGGGGGSGGGTITLLASAITLGASGRIGADGLPGPGDGSQAGGGGGAGGTIEIEAGAVALWGELTARGGDGGGGGASAYFLLGAGGGGGGGGGRIAVIGAVSGSPRIRVEGGAGGAGGSGGWGAAEDGEPGQDGTWVHVEPVCDDADLDGVCDDVDLCDGDDATGDADGDGWCAFDVLGSQVDCDDADPARFPGAPEQCNGLDDACVGSLPAEEADLDDDGVSICEGDCDDLDPADVCGQDEDEERGCGCASTTPAGWLGLLTVVGLAIRRCRS